MQVLDKGNYVVMTGLSQSPMPPGAKEKWWKMESEGVPGRQLPRC